MELFHSFQVEAAHQLPHVSAGMKCGRLHGHSFRIEVHVRGPLSQPEGWVVDFDDIAQAFKPLFDQLDHRYLNDIPGLENPTSENLAIWIWARIVQRLPGLSKVVVAATCNSGCVYEGA